MTRTVAIATDAALIDVAALAVTGAALLVESLFSNAHQTHKGVVAVVGGALFFLWVVGYFCVFWTTTGQTPGMRMMHIRVLRADGSRLRPRHALIRLGVMLLSLPLLWGYLPILTNRRRRGVPDDAAGTVVVLIPDSPPRASRGSRSKTITPAGSTR